MDVYSFLVVILFLLPSSVTHDFENDEQRHVPTLLRGKQENNAFGCLVGSHINAGLEFWLDVNMAFEDGSWELEPLIRVFNQSSLFCYVELQHCQDQPQETLCYCLKDIPGRMHMYEVVVNMSYFNRLVNSVFHAAMYDFKKDKYIYSNNVTLQPLPPKPEEILVINKRRLLPSHKSTTSAIVIRLSPASTLDIQYVVMNLRNPYVILMSLIQNGHKHSVKVVSKARARYVSDVASREPVLLLSFMELGHECHNVHFHRIYLQLIFTRLDNCARHSALTSGIPMIPVLGLLIVSLIKHLTLTDSPNCWVTL